MMFRRASAIPAVSAGGRRSSRARPLAAALLWALALPGATVPRLAAAEEGPAAAEVSATELLRQARSNREVLSDSFPGFRSKLTVQFDGREFHGTCLFRLRGTVQVTLQHTDDLPDVTAAVRSMLMHRVPASPTEPRRARYGKPDSSPLGRKVLLNDEYESAYRIRDGRIVQVDRRLAGPRFVITVLESETTATGRYLPRHVFAARLDRDTGAVREAWAYTSRFQRIDGEYLPLSRQVVRIDGGQPTTYRIEWSGIELLEPQGGGSADARPGQPVARHAGD